MHLKLLMITGFFSFLLLTNCSDSKQKETNYKEKIQNWQKERLKNLKAEDGWLNLAGLFWLDEGKNTIGSDSTKNIVFPGKAPKNLGYVQLKNNEITFRAKEDVIVSNKAGEKIDTALMRHDQQDNTTVLQHGSLRWFVIKRNDKFGIRLRDLQSPLLKKIDSIPAFPVKPEWKIEAEFIPYEEDQYMEVPNVLGGTNEEKVYGKLQFEINDTTYTLTPMGDRDHLFVVFGDKTNAEQTYGGGRFLSVPSPDEGNKTYLDFNKAYNPPCAFTPYATCPLPPSQNRLSVEVKAGEKALDIDVPHH
ncbi:MAG: DUF1684 domain-containing protein [Bacteroidota bacterium]